jgi:cobalt-zinc-cadmium efflux system protein
MLSLLLPMVGYILWESYQRFLDPIEIGTGPTLAIAVGGLLINIASVYILQGGEMSLNERGAFYHLIGDAGGSVAVIVSTVVIELTGLRIVDPLTAALIAVIVIWSAVKVIRGSGAIFLHRTPLDADTVRSRLLEMDGIEGIDDFDAWQICSQITVATTHIETDVETMTEADDVIGRIHKELAHQGVDHATVELSSTDTDRSTHLNRHTH